MTRVPTGGCIQHPEEIENLRDVAASGHYTAGRWCHQFERDLAKWFGVDHAIAVNSGSSANLLAVASVIEPGDEVITVAAAFASTVAPIVQRGGLPVFVDVQAPNYNVRVEELEQALTPQTKAVVLAHTLGMPFDSTVIGFCKRHGLRLVEDNCDAFGALWKPRILTGTLGDLGTLSFYPAHHMTTGEGGAVLTYDDDLARIVTSLRDWGRDCYCPPNCDNTCGKRFDQQFGTLPHGYDHKFVVSRLGYNLKMTDLQAAIGVAQLHHVDEAIGQRRKTWRFYREALAPLSDVLLLPEIPEDTNPSPFGFLITAQSGIYRRELVNFLEARRIGTRPLFTGNLLRHPAMERVPHVTIGDLEETDRAMRCAFWIGVSPLVTEEMSHYVVESIFSFFGRAP